MPTYYLVSGRTDRLVTQLCFDADPLNEKDQLLHRIRCKKCVTTKLLPPTAGLEPDSLLAPWDMILARG